MNELLFRDPAVKPDNELIFSVIGDKKVLWIEIMSHFKTSIPDFSGQWNYYKDGKSWLFKAVSRKKTIFWLGIMHNTFQISFYFSEKAEVLILNSGIPEYIKEEYRNARRFKIGRSISVLVNSPSDCNNIKELAEIKCKLK